MQDRDFIACHKEIHYGRCGEKSLEFISSPSRDLSKELMGGAVHIFLKWLLVQSFNLNILFSLQGVLVTFEAVDEEDVGGIQCPADRVLMLKLGCKAMLVWNKSDSLWNGSQGRFVGTRGNDVVIDFDGASCGEKGNMDQNIQNWRRCWKPYPDPPLFNVGITCHKSQGLTLPSAVTHCTKEFVPGLMAMTRVKSANHLQIIDFNKRQIFPPVTECINVSENHEEISESGLECCRNKVLSQEDLRIGDGFELPNEEEQGYDGMEVAATTDNL